MSVGLHFANRVLRIRQLRRAAMLSVLCIAATALPANAGSLLTVAGSMGGQYQNQAEYNGVDPSSGKSLDISIDYAVFAPGKFSSTFLGSTPGFTYSASEYVYAYQIFNDLDQKPNALNLFYVSFGSNPTLSYPVTHVAQTNNGLTGAIPYTTYISEPDATAFTFLDTKSADPGLTPGQQSYYILEASHDSPVIMTGTSELGYGTYALGGGTGITEYVSAPNLAIPVSSSGGSSAPTPLPSSAKQLLLLLSVASVAAFYKRIRSVFRPTPIALRA